MNYGIPSDISFQSISNPLILSPWDMREIHELIQDLWATQLGWLGEFLRCSSPACSKIFSKEQIFLTYPNASMEQIRENWWDNVLCTECWSSLKLIYGEWHFQELSLKMTQSPHAYMVLVRNMVGELVGHASYYLGNIDDIYQYELHYHYPHIRISDMRERIIKILGSAPEYMIVLSAIGLIPSYRGPTYLFRLMKQVVDEVRNTEAIRGYTWIMELDKTNPMYRIFTGLWWHDINAHAWLPELVARNVAPSYESRIVIFQDIYSRFHDFFNQATWPKSFIRQGEYLAKERR